MDPFKEKVAIVTGGASGIGRALCQELGRRGALVIVTDLNLDGSRQVASAIHQTGGQAWAVHLDVTQAEAVHHLIQEIHSKYGRIDFIFNNAGIAVVGEVRDQELEHWKKIMDVNLWGVIYGATAAYKLMVRQGFGHIVNIASVAGLISCPLLASYATTKHAVVGFSTSLRAEAADLGVKVTTVCPGFIQTGIFDASIDLGMSKDRLMPQIPFKTIDANSAARKILQGVTRNQAIINFPFYARFLWWLTRLHSSLPSPFHRKALRQFRSSRVES